MAGDDGEVSVQLIYDADRRWLVAPLSVGQDLVLWVVPNPGFPRSVISRQAAEDLASRGVLVASGRRAYVLHDLQIHGQPVPDVVVQPSPLTRVLGVDGILGFEFFAHYARACLDIATFLMTLTPA